MTEPTGKMPPAQATAYLDQKLAALRDALNASNRVAALAVIESIKTDGYPHAAQAIVDALIGLVDGKQILALLYPDSYPNPEQP